MRIRRRYGIGVSVAAAAAAVAAATLVAVGPSNAAGVASAPCTVAYNVPNQWYGGFIGTLTVTDNTAASQGWTLGFAFPGNQRELYGLGGTWSQTGRQVTLHATTTLTQGRATTVGFLASGDGRTSAPTAVTVNGRGCQVAGTTTSPPTTPGGGTSTPPAGGGTTAPGSGGAPQLHVSGNNLVDASGHTVLLHGVDRSGGEFACVQHNGMWDGPMDAASVAAIKAWGVNAVRVPLNEACWLGESYADPRASGASYQQAVKQYVDLLHAQGMVAILDLHWTDGTYTGPSSGCSSDEATCQKPMPDAAHAIPFWTSVANTFKGDNATVFDLFNEPYPDRAANGNAAAAWQCWLNGGTCTGISYQVAGMQAMVNAVRSTGARNVLMLGGPSYASDLSQWLAHEPTDPDHNLAASYHAYNFGGCNTTSCWDSQVAPVAAKVPLVVGELGENDCQDGFVNTLMAWLDSHHASYLAWTWNTWNCNSGPALITDYNGTPTAYGAGVRAHLLAVLQED